MNKRRLKLDFLLSCIPLFLMMLGSYILFFRLHLDLVYYRIGKADRRKDRLSYPISLFTSYLYLCSVLFIMYVAGFIAQLIIHIQHQRKERFASLRMLTAVLMLVPLFEDFSILGSS